MFTICSGILSGTPSPNIVLTNIIIGKVLCGMFLFSKSVNWYTLYLQIAQLLSVLFICRSLIHNKEVSFNTSVLIVLILFLGFFSLSIVKLQFTTVSLFCCVAALTSLQTNSSFLTPFFFIFLSVLIRKDAFFVFAAFSIPVFICAEKTRNFIITYSTAIVFAVFIFCASAFLNNKDAVYQKEQTYSNIKMLDIIAANPIQLDTFLLQKNHFTVNDITLLQSWFAADNAYLSGIKSVQIAEQLKSNRSPEQMKMELNKFMNDERYLLLVYLLSCCLVFFLSVSHWRTLVLNFLVFTALMLYLTITSRIPHRVTFPLLAYLIFVNIFLLLKSDKKEFVKTGVFLLLLIVSVYKFYCTSKLLTIQRQNHSFFSGCKAEINAHPGNLFIAADDFPLQYMYAWQTPENIFPAHNLILTGWYACTPDYQVLLKSHHLSNLTSDLRDKKNVLFLTNSTDLQNSYIQVMKERYHIRCHFEAQTQGFKMLHPKKLVFEN